MKHTDTKYDGKARQQATTFRVEVGVSVHIDAPVERVWGLLTDAPNYVHWNSTIVRMNGTIESGGAVELVAKVAPERTFKLKVHDVVPNKSMVWSDGVAPMFRGDRTYSLTSTGSGTDFDMVEVFKGLMLPMIGGKLPDFAPSFETFAADLKRAAERPAMENAR